MKIYIIDFEFLHEPGGHPRPWCVAWREAETGEENTIWLDGSDIRSPFPEEFRMVAHYAPAELACFLQLGWEPPTEVIDTLPETRTIRGQVPTAGGSWGLLAVSSQLGIPSMGSDRKEEMRQLAMADDVPFDRRDELTAYCLEDVRTTWAVWRKIEQRTNLPEAILRGRYLKASARVERRGIPADVDLVDRLVESMPRVQEAAWSEARQRYPGVISPEGRFSSRSWLSWCARSDIPWPKLPGGAPALDADTFKKMADRFPAVRTMAYARKLRSQSREFGFPLGEDGRLRCMLSPFASDTGRNQPSTSHYVFGASAWMRAVVAAPPGQVLAYIDYASQEVGLAAALSRDEALRHDYMSGDPYMAFAVRAGAAPEGATKASHPGERATYKVVMLSLQYGIGAESLARNLGIPVPAARRLIAAHKATYVTYWRWRSSVVDEVGCGGCLSTRYGWRRAAKPGKSANSIANFPVQAAGAEILRIAVVALEEAGHRVVAPVHDAVLVEMDESGWPEELAEIRRQMSKAATVVTGGLRIPTDVELVFPGENYIDDRGAEFWKIAAPVLGRAPFRLPEAERRPLLNRIYE